MTITTTTPKRKRIETLVSKALRGTAEAANRSARPSLLVTGVIRSFIEAWPAKYFGMADDRKIAGFVLAYMMEMAEIADEDMNEQGYLLLKVAAEVDLDEFRATTPRTYQQLRRHHFPANGNAEL